MAAKRRGNLLASHPAALSSIPSNPEIFSEEKLSMLLNNNAGMRKVDSALKMLIEPIQFWLVASRYSIKHQVSFNEQQTHRLILCLFYLC